MANQQVTVVMGAKDAELVRAWQNAKRGPEQMGQEIDKLKGKTKQANSESKQHLEMTISKAAIATAAFMGMGRAVMFVIDKRRELAAIADQKNIGLDERLTGYFNQAKIYDPQQQDVARKNLEALAMQNKQTMEQTIGVATQLVSSNFSRETVESPTGSTDALLKLMAATNAEEIDATQQVRAYSQFLAATGDRSEARLKKLAVAAAALFKSSDIQADWMQYIAKEGAVLSKVAKMDDNEIMAMFATTTEASDPSAAAISMRNAAIQFGAQKESVSEYLKEKGMDPERYDIQGEKFEEALANFDADLALQPAKERPKIMRKVFGAEHIASGYDMLGKLDTFKAQVQASKDAEDFEKSVAVRQTGPAADRRQADTAVSIAEANVADPFFENTRRRLRASGLKNGMGAASLDIADKALGWAYDLEMLPKYNRQGELQQPTGFLAQMEQKLLNPPQKIDPATNTPVKVEIVGQPNLPVRAPLNELQKAAPRGAGR